MIRMKVKLLAYTPDPEKLVAAAAKNCYSSTDVDSVLDGLTEEKTESFVNMLSEIGHESPIEHVSFTFAIEGVSRSLLAQITRHRLASFSVQSQRYVSVAGQEVFDYVCPPRIRDLGPEAQEKYLAQMKTMQRWYDEWTEALGEDAAEDARFVLPGAAATRMTVTMNARELLHFFSLRMCNRAQWEIRELAWQMYALVAPLAPAVFADAGPGCVRGATWKSCS